MITSRGIWIVNLDTNERLPIQMIPTEVRNEPEANWRAISSMGRNNPFYHYTGAEDTITFEVSWYTMTEDRLDVIGACKKLEAWSKSDGGKKGAPDIRIVWGKMFSDAIFKLVSASYQTKLPSRPHDLMPTLAYQNLTFKRISATNRDYADILNPYT